MVVDYVWPSNYSTYGMMYEQLRMLFAWDISVCPRILRQLNMLILDW